MDKSSVRPGEVIEYTCKGNYLFENVSVLPYITLNYTGSPSECDEEEYMISPLGEESSISQVSFFNLLYYKQLYINE